MQKDQYKRLPGSWELIPAESVNGDNGIKKTIKTSLLMPLFLTSSSRLEGYSGSLGKLRLSAIY